MAELSLGCKFGLGLAGAFVAGSTIVVLATLGATGYFNKDEPSAEPWRCKLPLPVALDECSIDIKILCNMGAAEFNTSTFVCDWFYGKVAKGPGVPVSSFVTGYDNAYTIKRAVCVPKHDGCDQHICCINIKDEFDLCTYSPLDLCNANWRTSVGAIRGKFVGCVTSGPEDLCVGCGVECDVFVYGHGETRVDNITCLGNQSYHFANESTLCLGLG